MAYKKVEDTRECSACVGTTAGGACGNNWGTSASQNICTAAVPPTTYAAGACIPNPGIGTLVNIGAMAPSGVTCNLTGGSAQGAAQSAEPVTYCCNR